MKTQIDLYIESKKYSWSDSTKRSERARLNSLSRGKHTCPEKMYEHLVNKNMKVYSIKTAFLRLKSFHDFLIESGVTDGPNLFSQFIQKNARLFKYAYERKSVEMSFSEGVKRCKTIRNDSCRRKALEIIGSGLRLSEHRAFDRDNGRVKGKGGKTRNIHIPDIKGSRRDYSDTTFRRELARVGLRPHDLRKLYATRLLQDGMNIVEVARLLGHTSITTTEKYIQDLNEKDLYKKIDASLKEIIE